MEVAFAKVQKADAEIGSGKAVRLIDRLGNLDCFFSMSDPLIELSTLGEALNEVNPREHGDNAGLAEALVEQLAFEGRDILSEYVHRPAVTTLCVIGASQ